MINVYVVEVTPAIDDAGTLQTFLFSSRGWATGPADSPANALVHGRLDQPGNFRRELFSGNRTTGAVRPSFGECTLINSDGGLDDFARYGFDGRAFKISVGPEGGAYPADFTTLITATLRGAIFDLSRVRLVIRDRMELLDRPISQATFAGTGSEEGSAEMTGKRKPLSYGLLRSIHPQLLNQSALLYSVGLPPSGGKSIAQYVTDGQGATIAAMADATSVADLMGASVTPGWCKRYPPMGLLRLGSQPALDLTCCVSVTNGAWVGQNEIGTILSQMAAQAGLSADAADVAAVDAATAGIYGYHINSDETALSAMGKIAASAFCWFGSGADDVLHMGVFSPPVAPHAIELRSHDIISIEKLDGGDANRLVPIWRAVAMCSHNNAPQNNFAGSCPEWYRVWARDEWPGEVVSENAAVKNKHLFADEMSVEVYGGTNLANPNTDGGAAAAAMALYAVERELVSVTLPLRPEKYHLFEIAAVVNLRFPRYGWDAGKLFRVVAIDTNFNNNRIQITLWG